MKKKISIIFIFCIVFLFQNFSYSEDKIAFIDLNFIFNNSNAGKKLNKQIEDKSKKMNSEFNEIKKKIESDKKKLLSQKNVITKEEYQKKIVELENEIKSYNNKISKKNQELAKFQNKARAEFSNQLKSILEEYSKKNSIGIIFRKENLLIGKNTLDVTKGILDLFNQNVKKIIIQ
jgi:Skp family chaperone for outer membrane proteins